MNVDNFNIITFLDLCDAYVIQGDLEALKEIWESSSQSIRADILSHNNYEIFSHAAHHATSDLFSYLWQHCSATQKSLISQILINNKLEQICRNIFCQSDYHILQYLWEASSSLERDRIRSHITTHGYPQQAFQAGLFDVLDFFKNIFDQNHGLITSTQASFFEILQDKRDMQSIRFAWDDLIPVERDIMLRSWRSYIHSIIIKNLELLKFLLTELENIEDDRHNSNKLSIKKQICSAAISKSDKSPNATLLLLNMIFNTLKQNEKKLLVLGNQCQLLRQAAEKNAEVVVSFLFSKIPTSSINRTLIESLFEMKPYSLIGFIWPKLSHETQRNFIAFCDSDLFWRTALAENLIGLKLLFPEDAISDSYRFSGKPKQLFLEMSSKFNDMKVMDFLWGKIATPQRADVIADQDYLVFYRAASFNKTELIKFLWDQATELGMEHAMFQSRGYITFLMLAYLNNEESLELLWSHASKDDRLALLNPNNYFVFRCAAFHKNQYLIQNLYNVATPEQQEEMSAVLERITVQLQNIDQEQSENPQMPSAIMDRDIIEFSQRYIDDRDEEYDEDDYIFDDEDEDEDADIGAESSMRLLSPVQQAQLGGLQDYYKITERNIPDIIQQLRAELVRRYEQNPVMLTDKNGHQIVLPINYESLQVILGQNFSVEEQQEILKSYYRHEAHTAYRYLLDHNNLWLHPNAVHGIYSAGLVKTTIFKQYQDIIALMFLAVTDTHIQWQIESSAEDRLSLFITCLGDIARAHNREATGFARVEQADDMQADKPSCHAGTVRRLFLSVIGHPLQQPVQEMIVAQIVQKMKEHFQSQINSENAPRFLEAWNDAIYMLNPESFPVLKELDPCADRLKDMAAQIISSLSMQLEGATRLQEYIRSEDFKQQLKSKLSLSSPEECYAIKFSQQTHLEQILNTAVSRAAENPASKRPRYK